MLVARRRLHESAVLCDPQQTLVLVTVLSTGGSAVKLGIHAPRRVRILREELMDTAAERPVDSSDGFLVIERKLNERVWIEGFGFVKVSQIRSSNVLLGFDELPDDVHMLRLELWTETHGPFTRFQLPWLGDAA